jgi:dienelactone hydrolase
MSEVAAGSIGVMGHSFGGKWAMFASCLHDRFAAAVWCDPGIVFDEARPNVNYQDRWYLGWDRDRKRGPGPVRLHKPRMGAYRELVQARRDLHELHALMAPRPLMVSGGAEDPPERWRALNHAIAVNRFLGFEHRVAMTNRPTHAPNEEANAQMFAFLEHALKG